MAKNINKSVDYTLRYIVVGDIGKIYLLFNSYLK